MFMTDSWSRWCGWVAESLPPALAFHKGIDTSGRDPSWSRVVPDDAAPSANRGVPDCSCICSDSEQDGPIIGAQGGQYGGPEVAFQESNNTTW